MSKTNATGTCVICGHQRPMRQTVAVNMVRHSMADRLQRRASGFTEPGARICRRCLNEERTAYLVEQLEVERGDLSAIEAEVTRKAAEHTAIAAHIDEQFERELRPGQRVADRVASVGGSWPFVIGFGICLAAWIVLNSWALRARAFDPYPYILLNLGLSCLAAIQAPIIMMSQNRSSARERVQADEDYRINLKAELEIAGLHDKVDHLLHVQWERMVEIQQTQLDLLRELAERGRL